MVYPESTRIIENRTPVEASSHYVSNNKEEGILPTRLRSLLDSAQNKNKNRESYGCIILQAVRYLISGVGRAD